MLHSNRILRSGAALSCLGTKEKRHANSQLSIWTLQDPDDDEDNDDKELEDRIAEEHAKFKEEQAKYQEKDRAARPWSAPPLGSPLPEKLAQRKRESEQLETLSEVSSTLEASNVSERNEYVPPQRPEVERAAAKGGSPVAYMAPPRPMSADTAR